MQKRIKNYLTHFDKIVSDIAGKIENSEIDEEPLNDIIYDLFSSCEQSEINVEGTENKIQIILDACGIEEGIALINKIYAGEGIQFTYAPDHALIEKAKEELISFLDKYFPKRRTVQYGLVTE